MFRIIFFVVACWSLGVHHANSQEVFLFSEIDPEWKAKSIDYWNSAAGKKIPQENIERINQVYSSADGDLSLEAYKQLRGTTLFTGANRTENPTALTITQGSFYVDIRGEVDLIIDRFPFYKKSFGTTSVDAVYHFIVFNSNGDKLVSENISQPLDLKDIKGEMRGLNYYQQDIDAYGLIIKNTKTEAIKSFIRKLENNSSFREALNNRSQQQASASNFNEEMKILFEGRKNKYPEHYAKFNISTYAARSVEKGIQTDAVPALNDQGVAQRVGDALRNVRNYALIIGVNDYLDPSVNDLDNPIEDAKQVMELLTTAYTFDKENVTFLKNPKREDIIKTFDHLARTLTSSDNLLIFYAGHGIWDENLKKGYWLPSDAQQSNRSKWFSNSDLRDYVGGIKSKHTLLIADACFSGGIFKTREAFTGASKAVLEIYKLPSRKAMTSGAMKTVPDKSVFIDYFLKRLRENTDPFLPSETLFATFKQAVINNSPNGQVPQFGEIRETGDEGGDFIFIKRY